MKTFLISGGYMKVQISKWCLSQIVKKMKITRKLKNDFSLDQLTMFQMGSSRIPIFFMKTSLHLTPLIPKGWVLGYGSRAHPLGLNLMSSHYLGHQSNSPGFATCISSKPKTHGWIFICKYKSIRLNHNK